MFIISNGNPIFIAGDSAIREEDSRIPFETRRDVKPVEFFAEIELL